MFLELHPFKLGKNAVSDRLGGNTSRIGDEKNRALHAKSVGGRVPVVHHIASARACLSADWYAVGAHLYANGLLVLRTIRIGQYQSYAARFCVRRRSHDLTSS